jgi:hypothetical protein
MIRRNSQSWNQVRRCIAPRHGFQRETHNWRRHSLPTRGEAHDSGLLDARRCRPDHTKARRPARLDLYSAGAEDPAPVGIAASIARTFTNFREPTLRLLRSRNLYWSPSREDQDLDGHVGHADPAPRRDRCGVVDSQQARARARARARYSAASARGLIGCGLMRHVADARYGYPGKVESDPGSKFRCSWWVGVEGKESQREDTQGRLHSSGPS